MDVLRINPSTWDADEIINNYSSFIWTERYQAIGEFELKTNYVDYTRALIPEQSMISLRDAQEVMIVETHSIENDSDGGPELTVTGRTFESFLENRATVIAKYDAGQDAMWTFSDDDVWPTDAAKALIMSHLTVCTQAPIQRVPNTAVENLITSHGGNDMSYEHEPSELYPEILSLLQMEGAGIRNQLDWEGNLKIYIYKGVNRSVYQDDRPALVFNLGAEHLVDPKYLLTVKDYKNVAYVIGTAWQERVYAPGVSESIDGLDLRILVVNADQIKSASSDSKKSKQAKALGLSALAKHNKTKFFDAEVSPTSPYVRGVDYNLGDRVTLMAKYGVAQTMLINEFVRTEDQDGERSYPTLVVPGGE